MTILRRIAPLAMVAIFALAILLLSEALAENRFLEIRYYVAGLPLRQVASAVVFTAADLERVIRHCMTAWHRARVVLVGFSFGADILAFLHQRLGIDIRQNTALIALLAPSTHASYEISVGGWVGAENARGPDVASAVNALTAPVLCVQSSEDRERPCDGITKPNVENLLMKGDHHFDGNYAPIVTRILAKTKK
ncbi:MAG: virulence factor [Rhodospirillaceae bacterium]|nr:virulence factor [Rhodospirillaceae bacterium]